MINLRYHIVSITAVFLALGIGIAMGSSFLSDAAVDQVDRNIQSTRAEARAARAEVAQLREEAARRDERDAALRDQAAIRLFRDHLEGVPVVLLTVGGVDRDSLDRLRTALATSGAAFAGTLTITDSMAVTGDDAATVARLLEREEEPEAALRSALINGVAQDLLAAAEPAAEGDDEPAPDPEEGTPVPPATSDDPVPPSTDPPAGEDIPDPSGDPGAEPVDPGSEPTPPGSEEEPLEEEPDPGALVRALIEEGFFEFTPAQDDVSPETVLAAPGHRYVIVSGADAEVADGVFFRPLLRALAEDRPAPVVVASAAVGDDPEADRDRVIAPLLAEDIVAARISTVDHLESLSGLSAVMLSLDDLGRDRRGHYGVGPEADSQLPPP